MTFKRASTVSSLNDVKYNSQTAKSFLDMYEDYIAESISKHNSYTPSKTFAPSSIRCPRQQWFRLRGTKPDTVKQPDTVLSFVANIGTDLHRTIQKNMSELLGEDWLDVSEYLKLNPPKYEYTVEKTGYETKVKVTNPPVHFSCDGLIKYQDKVYLIEIKTSEAIAMRNLTYPKSEHLDQIKCYCTLMGIDDALVLYQDRQYGNMKCFTFHLKDTDRDKVVNTFEEVLNYVSRNIVPPSLPVGDKWCNSSYCKYFRSCRKWGVY